MGEEPDWLVNRSAFHGYQLSEAGIDLSVVGVPEAPKRQFDIALIVVGGLLSGVLALATALLFGSWLDSGSGAGPTAATLNEAFSQLYGADAGLAVGAAFVAFAARTDASFLTGVLAGLFGYGVVLAPALVVTAPSDLSLAEAIETAALVAILVAPAVLLGAAAGAVIARRRRTGLYRRPR
jgi:hypothetical protein